MLYPIGIQSFEKLREGDYAYVDKTDLAYKLVKTGACYFLSHHRRFGIEYMTSEGRTHLVIKTKDCIYVMEFKYNKSSEAVIKQISDKRYALPFAVDGRKVIKIGCNFNPSTRNLDPWIIEQ